MRVEQSHMVPKDCNKKNQKNWLVRKRNLHPSLLTSNDLNSNVNASNDANSNVTDKKSNAPESKRRMPSLQLSMSVSTTSPSTGSRNGSPITKSSLILHNNAKCNIPHEEIHPHHHHDEESNETSLICNNCPQTRASPYSPCLRNHNSSNSNTNTIRSESLESDRHKMYKVNKKINKVGSEMGGPGGRGSDHRRIDCRHRHGSSVNCSKDCQKVGRAGGIQKDVGNLRIRNRGQEYSDDDDDDEKEEDDYPDEWDDDEGEGRAKRMMMTLTAGDSFMGTLMRWTIFALICTGISPLVKGDDRVGLGGNSWERPSGMPKIQHLEVMCGSQHMEVHLQFDSPFQGLVTSKGMYGQQDCVYVPPRTGKNQFVFNIYYDKCGTKPDNHGKFYENTVVVQYDEELIEAWDEAKRLRCEWFNDYEKTATKTSPMVISDLEVVELNFHGDNVDCWMEIQEGKGPWAPPLNGIAPLGSTLTMVIAVKDPSGEFDMRVKDCEASDGQTGKNLPLSDPEGCIIRPKLLGKFSKIKLDDGRATVLTYAFISAFKFPDMLNVHLRCTVEICRHGCPDHCTALKGGPGKGNLLGQFSENEPVAASSLSSETRVRPNALPNSDESGAKNGEGQGSPEATSNERPDVHKEALQNHQNSGESQQPPMQQIQAPPPPPPPQLPQQQPPPNQPISGEVPRFPHPQHRPPGPPPNSAEVPPQMRPPPPPQFSQRPQRHPGPIHGHGRPPPPPHHKFPPGLLRQRPDIHRFPPPPPGPLPPRFTGTIKHTMGGPEVSGPPEQQFMDEQQRHHAQMVQSMMMKPEPKNSSPEELRQRSGEPSKEEEDDEKTEEDKKDKIEDGSKEKVETEMLMEAQPLKDENKDSDQSKDDSKEEPVISSAFPKGPRNLRFRRSVPGSSDVVGVQGAFRVVSQADLNFAMNTNTTNSQPTIVLRGKMTQGEPIYGICLPRVGFGVVFFGLGLATLVAILIAAFLAYAHYTVVHYKGQHCNPVEGMPSMNHPSLPMPLPYQMFPMVMLKKMW